MDEHEARAALAIATRLDELRSELPRDLLILIRLASSVPADHAVELLSRLEQKMRDLTNAVLTTVRTDPADPRPLSAKNGGPAHPRRRPNLPGTITNAILRAISEVGDPVAMPDLFLKVQDHRPGTSRGAVFLQLQRLVAAGRVDEVTGVGYEQPSYKIPPSSGTLLKEARGAREAVE